MVPPKPLAPGTCVAGIYEVIRPLGHGGMGQVFDARNIRTERRVAVKILRPEAKHHDQVVSRFRREARALGLITSDHVLQVLAVEEDPEHGVVLAFERLEGESLFERLKREGPLPLPVLGPIVDAILQGLSDAHRAGVVHRDVKPSNVFLEQRPGGECRVKLLDFGISKLPGAQANTPLTAPGEGLGSYTFMPPEQFHSAAGVDSRADIYSLGILVYQSVSGRAPFSAADLAEMLRRKASGTTEPLLVGGAPAPTALAAWVRRAMQPSRDDRFQSADEARAAWREATSEPAPAAEWADAPTVVDGHTSFDPERFEPAGGALQPTLSLPRPSGGRQPIVTTGPGSPTYGKPMTAQGPSGALEATRAWQGAAPRTTTDPLAPPELATPMALQGGEESGLDAPEEEPRANERILLYVALGAACIGILLLGAVLLGAVPLGGR